MAHTASSPFLHKTNATLYSSFSSKTLRFTSNTLRFTFSNNNKTPLLLYLPSSSSSSRFSFHLTRVTTVPLDYAPLPAPDSNNNNNNDSNDYLFKELSRLKLLRSKLTDSKSLNEKLVVLNNDSRVNSFFKLSNKVICRILNSVKLELRELFLIKCLIAAGQQHVIGDNLEFEFSSQIDSTTMRSTMRNALCVLIEMIEKFNFSNSNVNSFDSVLKDEEIVDLGKLLKILDEIERFYDCIGGIIGYQIMVLQLLADSISEKQTTNWSQHIQESRDCQFLEIHTPNSVNLSKNKDYASQAALWGIEGLPDLGEIYPLGGSADRLGLIDPDTGECLPAAMLPYCGRTLLEGLVRDLQAREYLYFKLYGKQCITPVAIMTSAAKNNHQHISSVCERLGWFGRGRSSFRLFEQPLVPAVDAEDGQWLVTKPLSPVSKPGGHGVIWKLAHDNGIFQWFYNHGRKGATVRQVSNVVAATDLTLLALAGIGLHHGKKLGFASCERTAGATEGINVLLEKKTLDGNWAYGLSCVEYTEFDKFGIPNRLLPKFPANTNILYVDLSSVESIASSNTEKSLPGMVLNTKKPVVYTDNFGNRHSVLGGRLECTMQNIADNFLNTFISRCYHGVEDNLDTFIVYNERRKVTSSAKKKRRHGCRSLHQTPDGSLLDIMRNACDILSHCNIELPEIEGNDKYVDSGPPFLIFLHPALGPIWEVTRQKFRGGSISRGSELQIEVAEFLWKNVQLDGSLIVIAENAMGSTRIDSNGEPILQYGHRCGRCKLQNVKVLNQGIDWSYEENVYWKHNVQRFEAVKVILHGNAEFEANNVILEGNQIFEVPDGHKMKITPGDSGLDIQLDTIESDMMDTGSWFWNYKVDGTRIVLELIESKTLTVVL